MSYDISVVLLIPDNFKQDINELAEELGYGPDNLSIKLVGPNASVWWGCHTWCNASFLESFGSQQHTDALAALIVSVGDTSVLDHWSTALKEYNLELLEAPLA